MAFCPFVGLLCQDGSDEAMIASRVGKIPTESVRRRISRFRRSVGLFDQIWVHTSLGNVVNASTSARACSRCSATAGSFSA